MEPFARRTDRAIISNPYNRDRQLGIIVVTHQLHAFEGDRARYFNLAAGVLEEVTP